MARRKITVSAVGAVAAAAALNLTGPVLGRTVSFSVNGTVDVASQTSNFAAATLRYHCGFPLVGSQPVVAAVAGNTPPVIEVGRPVPSSVLSVQATFPSRAMWGLNLLGVAAFDGSAAMNSDIHAPQGDIPEKVALNVPRVGVPSSGSMTVSAAGSTPSVTFSQIGSGELDAGAVTMHLQGYTANGSRGLPFDVSCDLDSGQSGVVATFAITVAGPSSTAPSSSATQLPSSPSGVASHPATPSSGSNSGGTTSGTTVPASSTSTSSASAGGAAIAPVSTSDTGATGSAVPTDSAPALAAAAHASTVGASDSAAASAAVDKGAAVTDWLLVACALLLVGATGIFVAARLNRRT